eukprot:CAMPEP_0117680204 /NCGR_PEP_ID=MMETSP0804-20121206/18220_1 /TAXON_ID=1074897 /ORGANISM="Tetraselmis astigmatica, Strain CCMP880" /LENGTH=381 /DNA_ID=CAMNT_0005489671 /DNA_START=13 /DNA_END=1158 /DNA_ORIENTATION=+
MMAAHAWVRVSVDKVPTCEAVFGAGDLKNMQALAGSLELLESALPGQVPDEELVPPPSNAKFWQREVWIRAQTVSILAVHTLAALSDPNEQLQDKAPSSVEKQLKERGAISSVFGLALGVLSLSLDLVEEGNVVHEMLRLTTDRMLKRIDDVEVPLLDRLDVLEDRLEDRLPAVWDESTFESLIVQPFEDLLHAVYLYYINVLSDERQDGVYSRLYSKCDTAVGPAGLARRVGRAMTDYIIFQTSYGPASRRVLDDTLKFMEILDVLSAVSQLCHSVRQSSPGARCRKFNMVEATRKEIETAVLNGGGVQEVSQQPDISASRLQSFRVAVASAEKNGEQAEGWIARAAAPAEADQDPAGEVAEFHDDDIEQEGYDDDSFLI